MGGKTKSKRGGSGWEKQEWDEQQEIELTTEILSKHLPNIPWPDGTTLGQMLSFFNVKCVVRFQTSFQSSSSPHFFIHSLGCFPMRCTQKNTQNKSTGTLSTACQKKKKSAITCTTHCHSKRCCFQCRSNDTSWLSFLDLGPQNSVLEMNPVQNVVFHLQNVEILSFFSASPRSFQRTWTA